MDFGEDSFEELIPSASPLPSDLLDSLQLDSLPDPSSVAGSFMGGRSFTSRGKGWERCTYVATDTFPIITSEGEKPKIFVFPDLPRWFEGYSLLRTKSFYISNWLLELVNSAGSFSLPDVITHGFRRSYQAHHICNGSGPSYHNVLSHWTTAEFMPSEFFLEGSLGESVTVRLIIILAFHHPDRKHHPSQDINISVIRNSINVIDKKRGSTSRSVKRIPAATNIQDIVPDSGPIPISTPVPLNSTVETDIATSTDEPPTLQTQAPFSTADSNPVIIPLTSSSILCVPLYDPTIVPHVQLGQIRKTFSILNAIVPLQIKPPPSTATQQNIIVNVEFLPGIYNYSVTYRGRVLWIHDVIVTNKRRYYNTLNNFLGDFCTEDLMLHIFSKAASTGQIVATYGFKLSYV